MGLGHQVDWNRLEYSFNKNLSPHSRQLFLLPPLHFGPQSVFKVIKNFHFERPIRARRPKYFSKSWTTWMLNFCWMAVLTKTEVLGLKIMVDVSILIIWPNVRRHILVYNSQNLIRLFNSSLTKDNYVIIKTLIGDYRCCRCKIFWLREGDYGAPPSPSSEYMPQHNR